jgi:hypothetical protein
MHLEGCWLPGASLHAHACNARCLLFVASSRMQIHACSHKALHCPKQGTPKIITTFKYNYSPKIILQILHCMYPNIIVLKYYSPQATLLQVQAAIKQLQLISSQTYTCINIY